MIVRFCSCCEQQHSHSLLKPHPLQVDFSLLIGVHRIRPSEFEDIKLRRTLSLEMELLNAVAGGEDDHGLLRYRFGFVDITRTMTPMVTLLPSCAPLCRKTYVCLQRVIFGTIGRLMGGKTVQQPSSYAANLLEIVDLATE